MKFFVYFTLITLLTNIARAQEFIVKSVCIVPRDASRPDNQTIEKFKNLVEDTKHFYEKEMERHGYGSKTFRLETDREDKPVVEVINGKYSKNDYLKMKGPEDYAKQDLPISNRIYIVLVTGVNLVGGYNGTARIILDWTCAGCRGYAYIGERNGNFEFSTVAHELGHAFGLWHNLKGKDGDSTYLMWAGEERLDKDEARWLNKSPYFNRGFAANNPPRTTQVHKFEAFNIGGPDYIRLKIDMVGDNPLYQAQVFRSIDHCVVAWDTLSGRNDTAEFMIPKPDLFEDNKVFIQFMDSRGNQYLHAHPLNIPLDLKVTKTVHETRTDRTDGTNRTEDADMTETYLTLNYDSPDALVPTNYSKEWGWNWGGWQATWEKLPNKPIPAIPHQGFMPAEFIPYVNQWDYWFYAHVPSRIVYDLSGGNYAKFDAYFDIPNPCGSVASVQTIFLADDIEIYKSGVLRGNQARNTHISFDIPENTQSLTIKVTDGGDGGGCDHFIFANARLLHGDSAEVDVNQDGIVNTSDLVIIAANYGSRNATARQGDVNGDGVVDLKDFILVASVIDAANRAYTAPTWQPLVPRETSLLPNYPNPCNPETWIPYQLAHDTKVRIEIYAVDGRLIRTLPIGFQHSGSYVSKAQAGYWDGKNEVGEPVASGLYFYTLFAGDITQTQKIYVQK